MYDRGRRDPLFNAYMSGEYQKIFTGEIEGLKFKSKLDSFHEGKAIVDLKTTQDINKYYYVPDTGAHINFIEYFGYDTQLAIYRELVRQATGDTLRCFIAAVDKSEEPDIAVIEIPQNRLDEALEEVKANAWKIIALKSGDIAPIRCEMCDYCKRTKILEHVIGMDELGLDVR